MDERRDRIEEDRQSASKTPSVIDRDAVTGLFDRHFRPLAAYARRYTGSEDSACDVVQDVFVTLWEERATIHVRVSMQAMLYTMVRNRALNFRRDRRREQLDVPAEEAAESRSAAAATDDDLALRRAVYRWIDELPERRREAFMLSRFHDLSHAEIAEIMNVSERTVDTHILLALRSLRERLSRMRQEDEQP